MLDSERTSSGPSGSGCLLVAMWFAASMVGYLAGEWLGEAIESVLLGADAPRLLSIEGHVELAEPLGYIASGVGGLVAGVVLGVAQGLVLLPYFKTTGLLEWVIATTIGRAARWLALLIIAQPMAAMVLDKTYLEACLLLGLLVGIGVIAGLVLGYAQSVVLRRRVHYSGRWVLANLPGPVLMAIVIGLTLYIEGSNLIRDWTGPLAAAITAGLTGIVLMELLRQPTSEAEWSPQRQTP
jgi:hypothetical protein